MIRAALCFAIESANERIRKVEVDTDAASEEGSCLNDAAGMIVEETRCDDADANREGMDDDDSVDGCGSRCGCDESIDRFERE